MADLAIWGEAIARAMGYKNPEFIRIYYDNIGRQNVEATENNALAQAITKFVGSWYNEETPSSWQGPIRFTKPVYWYRLCTRFKGTGMAKV